MQYTEIMVRYGELSTKGKNRNDFIGRLNGNVTKALHEYTNLRIHPKRDRMHIVLNGDDADGVIERLRHVFGIQNFSPSIQVERDMDAVKATALAMMQEISQPGMSFKVNTRRSDHKFFLDTNEMNRELGGYLSDELPELEVQMKKPDITFRVEVRQDAIYLTSQVIQGAGGLPVGTAGKGMRPSSKKKAGYAEAKPYFIINICH